MTSSSPELIPTVEIVEEDPQTPTLKTVNAADAYDWQQRANTSEQELSVVRVKFEREKRRTRRLQSQLNEYIEALAYSTQSCEQIMKQCQLASNTSLAISEDLRRAKIMVETLEAVIVLLYTSSKDRDGTAGLKGGD
ncbi:uncharacterized protein BP5553_06883 [Venustampulla echinocandica]|uniref:Uncharacterized protein n=1 Tax=Venustampulla echinocandica TaxID=2656787 RepID=A0A370TL74_9HELO|nr:uncharacterized protein BP5553_06883 [Venustampulla echinocandica]RDL36271.1 hypothetical protein BP5553_06883 [Venustampulla echinocandica]